MSNQLQQSSWEAFYSDQRFEKRKDMSSIEEKIIGNNLKTIQIEVGEPFVVEVKDGDLVILRFIEHVQEVEFNPSTGSTIKVHTNLLK